MITSRIVGYPGSPLVGRSDELKLVPFGQKEIKRYVETRFNKDKEKGSELLRQLRGNPAMRGLAQNPLLLSMICKLFDESKEYLPKRRVELYKRCLDDFLIEWRKHRSAVSRDGTATRERKRQKKLVLLEKIAYRFTFIDTGQMSFKESFTLSEVYSLYNESEVDDIEDLLNEIIDNDGILIRFGTEEENRYMFLHLTFQEYLASRALSKKKDWLKKIKKYFWKTRWHEVIRPLAGTLKNPMPLIDTLCKEKRPLKPSSLSCHKVYGRDR